MYKNSKRFDNQKTISIPQGMTIAFVTRNGTKMGEHRIRQIEDGDGVKVAIAYNLIPAAGKTLPKNVHSGKDNDRRAYYILDFGAFCPHIHRADTCVVPCSFQKNTDKKVLAFTGSTDGVEVVVSDNGDKSLKFIPKPAGEEMDVTAFAIDLGKTVSDSVQKVRLVTLR